MYESLARESIEFSNDVSLGFIMKDASIRDEAVRQILPWIDRVARIMVFSGPGYLHHESPGLVQRLDDIIQEMRLAAVEKITKILSGEIEITSSVEGYLNVSLVGYAKNYVRQDHLIPVDLKVRERVPVQRINENFDIEDRERPLDQGCPVEDFYEEYGFSRCEREILDLIRYGHSEEVVASRMGMTSVALQQLLNMIRERIVGKKSTNGSKNNIPVTNKASRRFWKKMTYDEVASKVKLVGDEHIFVEKKCCGWTIAEIAVFTKRSTPTIIAALRKIMVTYQERTKAEAYTL